MRQLSLFDETTRLAGVMDAIKATMRAAASEGDGRKALPDRLNAIARASGVKLTGGNARGVSEEILHKWLSPSDATHPPSIPALLAFCLATGSHEPLRVMARCLGLDIMSDEDKRLRDYGKAVLDAKESRRRLKKFEEELQP